MPHDVREPKPIQSASPRRKPNPIEVGDSCIVFKDSSTQVGLIYAGAAGVFIWVGVLMLIPDANKTFANHFSYFWEAAVLILLLVVFLGDRGVRFLARRKVLRIDLANRTCRLSQNWPRRFDVRASLDDVVAYSCAVQPLIRWQYALAKTRPEYVLQSPWAAIRHRLLFKPLPVPRGIVIDVGDESMLISLGSNDSPPPIPHCLRTIGIRFEDRPNTTREIDVLF